MVLFFAVDCVLLATLRSQKRLGCSVNRNTVAGNDIMIAKTIGCEVLDNIPK